MTPFFFGTGARRLFGLYTPGNARSQRGVVLCHPWGQEYLRAHRSMRHLATLLSRAGVHVMRFDYFGTGDSAGEMSDGDLAGWQNDIQAAVAELKDTSGAVRVGLVGLRLGATLAARVAAAKPAAVDSVVLWDPIVKGSDYLREIRTLSVALEPYIDGVVPTRSEPGDAEQILGFDLTAPLAAEIGEIDLVPTLPKLPEKTLCVLSQQTPSEGALRDGIKGPVVAIDCAPAWLEDKGSGVGAIPVPAIHRIVSWFE